MDFTLDDEQRALRDAARGVLKGYDPERRRTVTSSDPGYDTAVWEQLAQMGLLGLPFAEADGGSGAGPVEVAVVAEEIGRVLAPEPYVAAVALAGGIVAAAGSSEQRASLLGGLSDGSYRVMFGCGFGDWIEQWYDGAASGADSTPVATTLDHVTGGVDAALEPYGSISGTVTGADTGTGVADICVLVESTTPSDSDHTYGDAQTDAAGHYRVAGLETGSYYVQFHDCGNQTYVDRYYGNAVDAASSTPVSVTLSQDTPGIDNEMVVGGAVTGTVTTADTGAPLPATR